MMAEPAQQVLRIADYLGVPLTPAQTGLIVRDNSLAANLQICRSLRNRPASLFHTVGDHRIDPSTQLHHNHIHSGKSGRWRDELSPDQGAALTETFKPWLIKLGYETETSIRHQLAAIPPERTAFATAPLTPRPHSLPGTLSIN